MADSTTSRVSFTLDSSLETVNKIEQTAELCAVRAGFDEDAVGNISMAIREAAVNAVLHGNDYDVNKTVKRPSKPLRKHSPSASPTRVQVSIQTQFPTRLPRKTSFAAPGVVSSSFERSWMRYTFASYIPVPN